MLLTELSTGFAVLAALCVVFCVVAMVWVRRAMIWIHRAADDLRRSAPANRVAEISAELTELRDAYDSLLKSHKKLRSRIGMRENRARKRQDDAEPVAADEKAALRVVARQQGHTKI